MSRSIVTHHIMLRTVVAGSSRAVVSSRTAAPALCWCQRAISSTASARSETVASSSYATPGSSQDAAFLSLGQSRQPFATPITTSEIEAEQAFEVAEVHLPLTQWPSEASSSESAYVSLPQYVFDSPARPDILHQCVRAHLSSLRQGTARTKNRAEVRGSQKKIMRQKGTGKARVGDAHSPIRRGGGRAFPKRQKDWTLGLNRKVWELGVRTALSERWRRGELTIIPDSPIFEAVSTRELVSSLHSPSLALVPQDGLAPSHKTVPKVLFLLSDPDPNLINSARNLEASGVRIMDVRDIDVYPLLLGSRVVLDIYAAQFLSNRFGKSDIHDRMSRAFIGEEGEEFIDEFDAEEDASADAVGQAEMEAVLKALEAEDPSLTGNGASRDGQTSPETDGGMKEQDAVIEGEESGVQEKRHPQDPLREQSGQDKGDAIRKEMDKVAEKQKNDVSSEDRPSAKDVL